jgi:F-type H+-transporting ATPase subunit alpha
MEEQVVALYAGVNGYLDDIPTEAVPRFQQEMREYVRSEHAEVYKAIRETGDLSDETSEKLNGAIDRFKGMFNVEAAAA